MGKTAGNFNSTATQETSSKTVNTTTSTTNIGSIGLTGQDAVQLATILEQGNVAQAQINQQNFEQLVQASGEEYQQLIGGASQLIQTGQANVAASYETLGHIADSVIQSNRDLISGVVASEGGGPVDFKNVQTDAMDYIKSHKVELGVAAAGLALTLYALSRRG